VSHSTALTRGFIPKHHLQQIIQAIRDTWNGFVIPTPKRLWMEHDY